MAKRKRRKPPKARLVKRLVPEPGTWENKIPAGMPDLPKAKPVKATAPKLTGREVYDKVQEDGLGHCIYDLIPADKISDKRLRILWKKARLSLRAVVDCLEEQ